MTAFIELEKQAVESTCSSIENEHHGNGDAANARSIQSAARQFAFLLNLVGSERSLDKPVPSSIGSTLADAFGKKARRASVQHRRTARYQRQFARLFAEMEAWLVELGSSSGSGSGNDRSSGGISSVAQPSGSSSSAAAIKPFDLERDSILLQVRSSQPGSATSGQQLQRKKKLDPMKCVHSHLCSQPVKKPCSEG